MSKTTWNPYSQAFEHMKKLSEEELKEYVFLRLTGREAEPEYNWSRNQELPESFLIWSYNADDPSFKRLFRKCIAEMLEAHASKIIQSDDRNENMLFEESIFSRLLHLSYTLEIPDALQLLKELLIDNGKLNRGNAYRLFRAQPIPWDDSLLHQSLAALSRLDAKAKHPTADYQFWKEIFEGRLEEEWNLPKDLRLIGLQSYARLNWSGAIAEGMPWIISGVFIPSITKGYNHEKLTRKLALLLQFFIEESKIQEADQLGGHRKATLLENPQRLVEAFRNTAGNRKLLRLLRDALQLLSNSRKLFGNNSETQHEWSNDFIPAILSTIVQPGGSVLERIKMRRLSEVDPLKRLALLRRINKLSESEAVSEPFTSAKAAQFALDQDRLDLPKPSSNY